MDKCLNSLIIDDKELLKQLEILVIIDGGTDKSSEIAHKYQNKYPETFIVIDKENGNYGSCINRGLKEAAGRYVKVLDADDSFETNNFEKFLFALKECNVDLILSDYVTVDEKGTIQSEISFPLPCNSDIEFDTICTRDCIKYIGMHAITYRTQILRDMDYRQTEGISYTDQEWIFLPMSNVHSVTYLDYNVYKYLVGRTGQTMEKSILLKNISHTMTGVLNMAREYSPLRGKLRVEVKEYMDSIIQKRCKYIYKNYLCNLNTLKISDLKKFDKDLLMISPIIYSISSKINYRLNYITVLRLFL